MTTPFQYVPWFPSLLRPPPTPPEPPLDPALAQLLLRVCEALLAASFLALAQLSQAQAASLAGLGWLEEGEGR
jgi:hypothetical protein